MKQSLFAPAMLLAMVGSLVMPSASFARTITKAPQYNQFIYSTISPGDVDAQELLEFLGIELQATDEVWSNPNFIAMVQKYRDFKQSALAIVDDASTSVHILLDMVALSSEIDHEAFEVERTAEEVEAMREMMIAQLEAVKVDPTLFVESLLSILVPFESDYEYSFDEQAPYAYGYSEPYQAVDTGRIVWLRDDSYNPLDSEMTISWEQTYGPEVTWLTTDSLTDVAFIMPSLEAEESDYLAFEVTADNGYTTDSYDVYVYWYRPYEGDVADVYREIMGEEIDADAYYYWDNLYYQGMSLEQIREHFEIMKKYGWEPTPYEDPGCYIDEEGYEVCG